MPNVVPVRIAAWVLIGLNLTACLSAPAYSGPPSDHFDGERFFTPGTADPKGFKDVLRWQLRRKPGRWSSYREVPYGPKPPARLEPGQLRVTFINHATMLIQAGPLNVLTDPIYAERASPFSFAGPRRVRPPGIRFEDLPPIDVVVISHNHYDHLDVETLRRLNAAFHPRILVGLGVAKLLEQEGIPGAAELDWWEHVVHAGVSLKAVPVQHFSNRGLCDRMATLWTGWVIDDGSGPVYFAGDTGYGSHFKEVRRRIGRIRLAILPIGAFEPEWFMGPIHLTPEEALDAHRDLDAEASVAMHFGTFDLADDDEWEAPARLRAGAALGKAGPKPFWVLDFGEGREVPKIPGS